MKSLIFSAPMVLALIAGRKTQTRRIIKPQPPSGFMSGDVAAITNGERWAISKMPGHQAWPADPKPGLMPPRRVGDTLYVRETWRPRVVHSHGLNECDCSDVEIAYAADGATRFISGWDLSDDETADHWTIPKAAKRGNVSPLLMPAWASRLHLTITDVRVERVQDISEKDARAEGCDGKCPVGNVPAYQAGPCSYHYAQVWESLHGPASWDANPWCWCYTFTVKKIGGA